MSGVLREGRCAQRVRARCVCCDAHLTHAVARRRYARRTCVRVFVLCLNALSDPAVHLMKAHALEALGRTAEAEVCFCACVCAMIPRQR